jgi:gas vesicle protein
MKTTPIRFAIVAAVTGVSALFFAGCSKQDRNTVSAKTSEAVADTKNAMSNAWDSVKSHTWEKRDDFTTNAKAVTSRFDAQLSELRANYSEAKASASRKAAMADLKNSEADYKEKVGALGNATAATWDSGKQNVIAAWDRLQASYYKARAN